MEKKLLICGIGDCLKQDDGLGPFVIQQLESFSFPPQVVLRDFGLAGIGMAFELTGYEKVVVIDAIQLKKRPGQIYKFVLSPPFCSSQLKGGTLSLHEIQLDRIISWAKLLGNMPEQIVILGCEPQKVEFGLGLTPPVKKSSQKIVSMVIKEIKNELYNC
jgi:hydrogenase maturation protease